MKEKIQKAFAILSIPCRIILGSVFVLAAYGKIIEPYNFALSIATYQMMPLWIINLMAIILPWLEIFCGIMMIIGFKTKANTFIINVMLIVFIIAIWQALSRDLMLSTCGCFSSENAKDEVTYATLFRDFLFLFMGIIIILFDRDYLSLNYLLNRR